MKFIKKALVLGVYAFTLSSFLGVATASASAAADVCNLLLKGQKSPSSIQHITFEKFLQKNGGKPKTAKIGKTAKTENANTKLSNFMSKSPQGKAIAEVTKALEKDQKLIRKIFSAKNVCGDKTQKAKSSRWFYNQLNSLGIITKISNLAQLDAMKLANANQGASKLPNIANILISPAFAAVKKENADVYYAVNVDIDVTAVVGGVSATVELVIPATFLMPMRDEDRAKLAKRHQPRTFISSGFAGGVTAGADIGIGFMVYGHKPLTKIVGAAMTVLIPGTAYIEFTPGYADPNTFPGWADTVELGAEVGPGGVSIIAVQVRDRIVGVGFTAGVGKSVGFLTYARDFTNTANGWKRSLSNVAGTIAKQAEKDANAVANTVEKSANSVANTVTNDANAVANTVEKSANNVAKQAEKDANRVKNSAKKTIKKIF